MGLVPAEGAVQEPACVLDHGQDIRHELWPELQLCRSAVMGTGTE
jgi:hypothetical protein